MVNVCLYLIIYSTHKPTEVFQPLWGLMNSFPMNNSVKSMFSRISDRYDLLNTILSFGIHHSWKNSLVNLSNSKNGMKILDCATGTGDIAIKFRKHLGDECSVTGMDFCEDMLKIARNKAFNQGVNIIFESGDVLNLKYQDNEFDISSIAFGIRNVQDPVRCLKEMARVVKPDGIVLILEFGQPVFPISYIYRFYSKYIIPIIGLIMSGDSKAYNYLNETASVYPCREKFINIMNQADCFSDCSFISLSSGIAYIYKGIVK